MTDPAAVTAADIARLAGVTRGTVSNWRRRHADFPAPAGGTDASPAFDRGEVEAWLAGRGALPEASPDDQLWRAVNVPADRPLDEVLAWTAELLTDLAEGPVVNPSPVGAGYAEIRRIVTTEPPGRTPEETLGALTGRYADSISVSATPWPLAELMADLADARGTDVFDPAAGTGDLLAAGLRYGDPDHGPAGAFGQEIDTGLARLADALLSLITDDGESKVEAGDSLRDDRFPGLRVHSVLCHPPFGVRDWGLDELADDPRWEYGVPPRSEPELAWVQHALAHLEPGGRAALLMPPAAASRPSGRRIRAELLRRGALRGVTSLPAGAVRPRHVPVHLWLLERPGSQQTPDPRVLFVEGGGHAIDPEGDTTSAPGWVDFAEMARTAWDAFQAGEAAVAGEPGSWQVVRAIDLLDEAVDLTPARHVGVAESAVSPARTLDEVRVLTGRLRAALTEAGAGLPAADVHPVDSAPPWRTTTVSDLARQGTLEFYRWPGRTDGKADGRTREMSVLAGDVLVPATSSGQVCGTVVDDRNENAPGQFHVIRPNPALLDPWYLAGFLAAPASVQQASYGTAMTRIDARRLTVPILPLHLQRRYGEIFKRLHDLSAAIEEARDLADDLTGLLARSLADGTLQPAETRSDAP